MQHKRKNDRLKRHLAYLPGLLFLFLLFACAQVNEPQTKDQDFTGPGESEEVPFPHPDGFADPKQHGDVALSSDSELVPSRCTGCHQIYAQTSQGVPGCHNCHQDYPHQRDFDQPEEHGASALDSDSRLVPQRCDGCHEMYAQTSEGVIGCQNCHQNYPHEENFDQAEQHAPAAVDENNQLVPSRCDSCHEMYDQTSEGVIGCQNCHQNYPHQPDFDQAEKHAPAALNEDNQLVTSRCNGCHEIYGQTSDDTPGCQNCHQNYPHQPGFDQAEQHGLVVFQNPAAQLTDCSHCHGADLSGGVYGASCTSCHSMPDQSAPVQHRPAAPFDCTACHAQTADQINAEHLLKAPVPTLCATTGCHSDFELNHSLTHKPVVTQGKCLNCHRPHDANHDKLLPTIERELCFSCHDKTLSSPQHGLTRNILAEWTGSTNRHGPFAAGECSTCHTVHGGSNLHLMQDNDPMFGLEGDTVIEDLSCFTRCHQHDIDDYTTTSTSGTSFLQNPDDGLANLHTYHLIPATSGCLSCHTAHGNYDIHLLRDWFDYQAPTSQYWEKADCSDTCHFGGTTPSGDLW